MRLAVIGAGGVGGYFGGRLAAKGEDVTFVARGAHLAAMRTNGLTINSPDGDVVVPRVQATDDTRTIGPVDVVLFAVKLYDMATALQILPPLIGPQTVVVPLQNGVAAVEQLTTAVGAEHAAGGTCYVSAVIDRPGVIRHTAMGRLLFGPVSGPPPAALQHLQAACQGAGFEGVLSDRIIVDIWTKFTRLAAFSGVTSVTRSPLGTIVGDADLRSLLVDALTESFAVARASGVPLDAAIIPQVVANWDSMPPGTKSSMLEDLERGRPLELPFLSGTVARLGETLGVPTPTHRFITTALKPFVHGRPSGS